MRNIKGDTAKVPVAPQVHASPPETQAGPVVPPAPAPLVWQTAPPIYLSNGRTVPVADCTEIYSPKHFGREAQLFPPDAPDCASVRLPPRPKARTEPSRGRR